MNTQDKEHSLTQFLKSLPQTPSHCPTIPEMPIPCAPEIDLISEVLAHERYINQTMASTYSSVKTVLEELSELETQKYNINRLLDSMTAIKEIKRLAFGLGETPAEIYRNLQVYYQVKDKLFYCDKYVQLVEQEIGKVKTNFEQELQKQLRKTNSDSITELSKTLALISSSNSSTSSLATSSSPCPHSPQIQLLTFYRSELQKQLKTFEQDLFKIPITAPPGTTNNNYIFFEIAKDIMKLVVGMVTSYKANIIKVCGIPGLQTVVAGLFEHLMAGIMLEILAREKKYFDVDTTDAKKLTKSTKFKDYLNEFCAIWNQIQRLRSHLLSEVPEIPASPSRQAFQSRLVNSTNSKQLLTINHQTSQSIKLYTRFQFNNLLKTSTFVNSIFQLEYEFLNSVYNGYVKSGAMECADAQSFVVDTFAIIMKPLEKAFESLNLLIISPLITFANTTLIQEDSFHAFTQLFSKILSKSPPYQQKHYTALILLLNTVITMPNILRTQISCFRIPSELDTYGTRLQNELKQLGEVCEYRAKQVLAGFVGSLVESAWFCAEIRQDYRKALQKWKPLGQEVADIFFNRVSQLHSTMVLADQFNLKTPKKIVSQQGVLALEREVRGLVTFYELKGCSALNSFKKVLQYIEIMLADGDDNANKLFTQFNMSDPQEIQKLKLLRAMKVD